MVLGRRPRRGSSTNAALLNIYDNSAFPRPTTFELTLAIFGVRYLARLQQVFVAYVAAVRTASRRLPSSESLLAIFGFNHLTSS